mmetsp:Transcript_47653/g.77277  ORF Transcript_47653/g.77277 Transcript_47653/m.77277 type:complete len:220 (+) Transcript_47653:1711-2370(+)
MLNPPGANPKGVQGVILEACPHNEVVVRQHRAVVQDAALLLPVDLHHAAVKNADPKLQHDPSQLLVRISCGASNQWKVMRMMIFQSTRRQERQRVEMQMRNAEQALKERQPAIAGTHDHNPRIHWNLSLTEQLLGHNGQGLCLTRVAQQLLPLLFPHVFLSWNFLLDVHKRGYLWRLPQGLFQLRWPSRRHLQQLPEDWRDCGQKICLNEQDRPAANPH